MDDRRAGTLYPYLVPDAIVDATFDWREAGIARPLGHGISAGLVFDVGVAVEYADEASLNLLGLDVGAAHALSVENLQQLARSRQIDMVQYPTGPMQRPFILVGGFWAASALLLPGLHGIAAPVIGADRLLASVPHRDAMLIFPHDDRPYRDAMRDLVCANEPDGEKPLTFELFTVNPGGVEPFAEES